MNLHAVVTGVIQAVNQSLLGTLQQSNGYTFAGDATFTGSISGAVLTVSAITSGVLASDSVIASTDTLSGTLVVDQLTGLPGGIGTYAVSKSQTVGPEAMTASGNGARAPQYIITTGIPMQFQAVSSDDLKHVDGLNISTTLRSVHLNGDLQGIDRPGVRGGDILLATTGLTGVSLDTWLVVGVPEGWDASGWCQVIVALQQATQSQ